MMLSYSLLMLLAQGRTFPKTAYIRVYALQHTYVLATRREFLTEILYKNIAITAIQHSKMHFVDTFAIFPVLLSEIHSSPSGKFPYTY